MRNILTALIAAATLTAPVAAAPRLGPDGQLAKLLAGREAGRPSSCISPIRSSSAQIIDGTAIVYRDGRTLWVNRPRSGAAFLRDDDILVTRQFGTQLCRVDLVRLVSRGSGFPRGFIALGDFVPYRLPDRS